MRLKSKPPTAQILNGGVYCLRKFSRTLLCMKGYGRLIERARTDAQLTPSELAAGGSTLRPWTPRKEARLVARHSPLPVFPVPEVVVTNHLLITA